MKVADKTELDKAARKPLIRKRYRIEEYTIIRKERALRPFLKI
jgi:hypothetical protein